MSAIVVADLPDVAQHTKNAFYAAMGTSEEMIKGAYNLTGLSRAVAAVTAAMHARLNREERRGAADEGEDEGGVPVVGRDGGGADEAAGVDPEEGEAVHAAVGPGVRAGGGGEGEGGGRGVGGGGAGRDPATPVFNLLARYVAASSQKKRAEGRLEGLAMPLAKRRLPLGGEGNGGQDEHGGPA